MRTTSLALALLMVAATAIPAFGAPDVLTARSTSASAGSTTRIPLYLRDVSTTPLGVDKGSGKRIQAFALRVTFSPAGAVTAASFARAGVLTGITPLYEHTVTTPNALAWIGSFSESSMPVPFLSDTQIPGNRIGVLTLTLAPGLANGSSIAIAFDPATTLLSNDSVSLTESTFTHTLSLVAGSIAIGGANTNTSLSTSPNPSAPGSPVMLTATVTSDTPGAITGLVGFYDGAEELGYAKVQGGQAILTTVALTAGSHSISATYEGDLSYRPSTSNTVSQIVNPPLAAPLNVVANGTGATTATITWSAVAGATSYEVRRRVNNGAWVLAGSPGVTSLNDGGLTANSAYLYVVRAVGASGSSADSALDIATTVVFTDDPVVAGTTAVKAVHLTQLRTAANALRVSAGLAPATFTDPVVNAGSTATRKVHIDELRAAIVAARAALAISPASFTDPTLTVNTTLVKATHIQQLRTAVK